MTSARLKRRSPRMKYRYLNIMKRSFPENGVGLIEERSQWLNGGEEKTYRYKRSLNPDSPSCELWGVPRSSYYPNLKSKDKSKESREGDHVLFTCPVDSTTGEQEVSREAVELLT